jgi:hypothetical protein
LKRGIHRLLESKSRLSRRRSGDDEYERAAQGARTPPHLDIPSTSGEYADVRIHDD